MAIRKWEQDIIVCIKRFDRCEELLNEWLRTAGSYGTEIYNYLAVEGNTELELLPHPYLKMNTDEKRAFRQCYGSPLSVPARLLTGITVKDFIHILDEKRDLYKETVSHKSQSRFRSFTRKNNNKRNTNNGGKPSPPQK